LPIGSQPAMIPARTQDASFPYTRAATQTGTDPSAKVCTSILFVLLRSTFLGYQWCITTKAEYHALLSPAYWKKEKRV